MSRVKLAIVGCGTISALNARGYLRDERCEVVALCDPVRERAQRRAAEWGISPKIYASYEDVLNDSDIDAVELLTPTPLHAEQAIAGLEAGKHVSCQKPIAASMRDADRIVDAADRSDALFRVTENFLFYPPIVKAKQLLEQGAIGEPNLLRIRSVVGSEEATANDFTIGPGAMDWRRDAGRNPGGKLFDDGVHKYATAMWWIGELKDVYSVLTKDDDDFVKEAPSVSTWTFSGKSCIGVIDYGHAELMPIRARYYPMDEFFEIVGSKGVLWVTRCTGEMLDLPPVVVHYGRKSVAYDAPMDFIEGFNGAARHFIDCILSGEQPMMDARFARSVLQAALAVYRSSELGARVELSSIR